MKLRIQGDSVRLRLRHSEVDSLAKVGRLVSSIQFGGRALEYSLELVADLASPRTDFVEDSIRVLVPYAAGLEWCLGPQISLTSTSAQPTVLIEKDFVRSAVEEPDDYDRFENVRTGRKPPAPPEKPIRLA